MEIKNKLLKDITKGKSYKVEFKVTASMVERFINLTGDCSSLHTDKTFARRSAYRENVVHGMLPVMFISALNLCHIKEHKCFFDEVSARFLKPVFINDRLIINAEIIDVDEERGLARLEFVIKRAGKEIILITGNFVIGYNNSVGDKNRINKSKQSNSMSCMVIDSLKEQNSEFNQIYKGDEKCFQFLILENHTYMLYEILKEGLLPDFNSNSFGRINDCDTINLLSSCLFSTFVGMCIPGRYATFTDFSVKFHKLIQLQKKYLFTGKVEFKSESTCTLIEKLLIHDLENETEIYADGKISVKIGEPPVMMPSIEFIKNNELDLQLKDKVVLVTGASRGIGETTAKLFSLYGAKVVINYFQGREDANRVVSEVIGNGGDAVAVQADVSDKQQVKQMISDICKKYETIHILVNNAVRDASSVPFMELEWEDFQKDIDVNIKGVFNCCQEVLPLMIKNKGGKIINVSTVFTDNPPPNQSKYVVSKSGIVGLTRSLAVEFASQNIQVNMVVPSIIETDLTKHIPKMFIEGMKKSTPMKRNASSVDVAKAVIFLASSLASFTTGQKIMVTGGNPPFL